MTAPMPLMRAALCCCLLSLTAHAGGKKAPPKLDLGLPSFNAIPAGDDVRKTKGKGEELPQTRETPTGASYSVVRVLHAKAFVAGPQGAQPSAPFESVKATGNPATTERFSTVVRVKCPEKLNSDIDVAVLDVHGDTLMESTGGTLAFRGLKQDELDYTVEWSPTPVRQGGDFQISVRIGGQAMGTFPLKVTLVK